jgi:adenine-specific DNA-methyltransferase
LAGKPSIGTETLFRQTRPPLLAFLCPGNWTRNKYGAYVRQALTKGGRLEAIIDFTDVDSFEKSADAYPSYFVFNKGKAGSTEILSVSASRNGLAPVAKPVCRTFPASSAPLLLAGDHIARFLDQATRDFPSLEDAGCSVRVGSATGCDSVFLGTDQELLVETDRLLPFVNARSIRNARVHWSGTRIVNVFDRNGRPANLEAFPLLSAYLSRHKKALKSRAKAGRSACWWRSIDVLHHEWYASPKLLIADIASRPVVGLDDTGYCAGSGVYQIKSSSWPLEDLLDVLSAGILGTFIGAMSQRSQNGFNRFQKQHIGKIRLPRWDQIEVDWLRRFREARVSRNATSALELVAELYRCDVGILAANTARDWPAFGGHDEGETRTGARKAMDGERADGGESGRRKGGAHTRTPDGPVEDQRAISRHRAAA